MFIKHSGRAIKKLEMDNHVHAKNNKLNQEQITYYKSLIIHLLGLSNLYYLFSSKKLCFSYPGAELAGWVMTSFCMQFENQIENTRH